MDDKIKKKVLYIVMQIRKFSQGKNLSQKDAFVYLKKFGAMDFLDECYEAEHTLSDKTVFDDLDDLAKKNGGTL
jgi:hypothetical protein